MIKKYLSDPSFIVGPFFKDVVWETINNKVLLTFDDGPNPESSIIILEKLAKYNLKAVMFFLAENVEKYPKLAQKFIDEGHTIANHSYTHPNMIIMGYNRAYEEINRSNKIIYDNIGVMPDYFRPPYGRFNFSTFNAARDNKLRSIMWNLTTYDYDKDINIVKFVVSKKMKQNTIAVFHDNDKAKNISAESIEYFVEIAKSKKLSIGTPEECLP